MNTRGGSRHPEPGWRVDAGTYVVELGAAVANIRCQLEVTSDEWRIGP